MLTEKEKGFIDWAKAHEDPSRIDWSKAREDFQNINFDVLRGELGVTAEKEATRFPLLTPMIAEKLQPEPVPFGAPLGEQASKIGLNILKDVGAFSTWPLAAMETLLHPGARPTQEEIPAPLRGTPLERPGAVAKGLFWEFPKAVGRSFADITTGIALAPQAQLPGLFGRLKPAEQKRYQASLERLAEHPLVPIAGALGLKGLGIAGKRFVEPTAQYKAAVKVAERPEMADIETYYKSITQPPRPEHPMGLGGAVIYPQKLGVAEAQARGIALRETKAGKLVPSVREAGTFVPEDFATYPNFKDTNWGVGGGTKDPIRAIQETDGALSFQKKVGLPGQEGPTERYILRRTEDMTKLKLRWEAEQIVRGRKIVDGLSRKQEELVTQVLEETTRPGAYVETGDLATNPRIKKITTDTRVVRAAQESRKALEHWFKKQNVMRELRAQELIPYREYYAPHKIREATLWSRRFGLREKPGKIMESPQAPDYIKPDKPFNPRELAREAEMPDYLREMRISRLLEDYIYTASRDIFYTSIIQNGKAFVRQFESMGLRYAAEGISDWMAEGFGGIKGGLDRKFALPRGVRGAMRTWRVGLIKSVFPLNWLWNTTVQTLSSALTVAKGGATNSVQGFYDWFGDASLRAKIADPTTGAYSAIIKAQRAGKVSMQDVNVGMIKAAKLRKTKFETAFDAANFLTELVERHLTGWSVATGLRQGAKRGLRGKPLWDYASDMGFKTQSAYHHEGVPGVLRNEIVKTGSPFQTFRFEMYNTMKEFMGKTGMPPGTISERIGWVLRFTAGVIAGNEIAHAISGRRPWDAYSLFPFSDYWAKPIVAALTGREYGTYTRGLPSPIGAGRDLAVGVRTLLTTGNTRKIRTWMIRYLPGLWKVPGGTQMAKMVDGIIAVADGGMEDSSDRMLFPITETKEQIRAITMGPWRTEAGREYWEKREVPFTEMFKRKEKKLPFTPLRGTP